MTDPRDPDIWNLVFEQTPPALRWMMGMLTLGLFTLASILWKQHKANLDRVEKQFNDRFDQTEKKIYARMESMERRWDAGMSQVNGRLIEIARNTRK